MNRDSYLDEFSLPEYNSRVFHDLPNWEKLASLGDSIYLNKNHYLVEPGDEVKYCYLIKEGCIITLEITDEGELHIFNIFEPGSLLLESNVLAHYKSDIYCQTTQPSELIRISGDSLREGIRTDPDILNTVAESFASKYYSAMDQLRENYSHDATWRVYNMLLLLAQNQGKPYYDDWTMIDMKVNGQFICSMLGINRVTVSRALKKLREQNLITVVDSKYCVRRGAFLKP